MWAFFQGEAQREVVTHDRRMLSLTRHPEALGFSVQECIFPLWGILAPPPPRQPELAYPLIPVICHLGREDRDQEHLFFNSLQGSFAARIILEPLRWNLLFKMQIDPLS